MIPDCLHCKVQPPEDTVKSWSVYEVPVWTEGHTGESLGGKFCNVGTTGTGLVLASGMVNSQGTLGQGKEGSSAKEAYGQSHFFFLFYSTTQNFGLFYKLSRVCRIIYFSNLVCFCFCFFTINYFFSFQLILPNEDRKSVVSSHTTK